VALRRSYESSSNKVEDCSCVTSTSSTLNLCSLNAKFHYLSIPHSQSIPIKVTSIGIQLKISSKSNPAMLHKQPPPRASPSPPPTATPAPRSDTARALTRHPATEKQTKTTTTTTTTTKTLLHRPLSAASALTAGAQQQRRRRLRSVARRLRHAEYGNAGGGSSRPARPPRGQDAGGDNVARRRALPATTRAGLERELAALRHEEAVARAEAARTGVMRRYKMVRFFGGCPYLPPSPLPLSHTI
jgi:hypothetical protein